MVGNKNAEKNAELVQRLFKEGYTQGKNPNIFREVIASDVMLYDASSPNFPGGLDAYIKREDGYNRAFPNKVATIDEIISSGDQVVVRWTVKGTHKGDLPGIKATGNHIHISGITIFSFANGKIDEIYQSWDRLGLVEQLGQTTLSKALV